ncbi:unnamed protein product [Notodromas monacha]|uniref:Metalloendopeptidase n=1 Tax=Notodromas monacha TaxID=399045 RepID=A0A7R9GCC8_9CRUS|nr:unnamed protein product [Notodromas monacha]CAG0915704.1 unnamed protein product [Notodromas monacha]
MDLIEAGTCIKFRPRRSEPGHVKIFKRLPGESGVCGSELGYAKNKVHTLVLGSSRCFVPGRLLHEFMHVLGFPHEQNRGDRDKYITVNWKNMERGMELNYRKLNGRYTNAGPYDYYSILHYSLYSSAKDPLVRTLIPRQEVDESMVGQRRGFSKIDLEKLNTFYGCKQQQEPITEPREGVDNDSDADEGEGSSDDEVISVNDINKAVMSPEQMEMPTGYWETFNPQNLW